MRCSVAASVIGLHIRSSTHLLLCCKPLPADASGHADCVTRHLNSQPMAVCCCGLQGSTSTAGTPCPGPSSAARPKLWPGAPLATTASVGAALMHIMCVAALDGLVRCGPPCGWCSTGLECNFTVCLPATVCVSCADHCCNADWPAIRDRQACCRLGGRLGPAPTSSSLH